ncbi:MAG: hypothetical protein FWE95_10130 [Planctomycetaceae bacterium]|nr:hypothetical protein [Planctomycetaceae bacterium]
MPRWGGFAIERLRLCLLRTGTTDTSQSALADQPPGGTLAIATFKGEVSVNGG